MVVKTLECDFHVHTPKSSNQNTLLIGFDWLLFYTNSAIFQLYHDENKLIFNEMMMRSALY